LGIITSQQFGKVGVLTCLAANVAAGPVLSSFSFDAGGGTASNGIIRVQTSIGLYGEILTSGDGDNVIKSGYIGRIFDIDKLEIQGPGGPVPEGSSLQLSAVAINDDETRSQCISANWVPLGGAVDSVNTDGWVQLSTVYQDTQAVVGASCSDRSAEKAIAVLDLQRDNFGVYAFDGIWDAWQIAFFGPANSNGAPDADPDGDGQANMFEFVAGTSPLERSDFFQFEIQQLGGATSRVLRLVPAFPDRTYKIKRRPNLLAGDWTVCAGALYVTNGLDLLVTDTAATNACNFYRAVIEYAW